MWVNGGCGKELLFLRGQEQDTEGKLRPERVGLPKVLQGSWGRVCPGLLTDGCSFRPVRPAVKEAGPAAFTIIWAIKAGRWSCWTEHSS